jgi:hypothetical protein
MSGWRRLIGFLGLTVLAFVIAHNLEFLVAFGARAHQTLAQTGHGATWNMAVVVVLTSAVAFVAIAGWRLRQLTKLAGALADRQELGSEPALGASFERRLVARWVPLTVASSILFVVQENLEHLRVGLALPGLGVLGSAEYPFACIVIAEVALAVAFVSVLFSRRREALIARIAAARRAALPRPRPVLGRSPSDRDVRPESHLGRSRALRAPPLPTTL